MAEASTAAPVTVLAPASGPGARRAAAVLLGLGPELAQAVFRLLGEGEIRRIALGAKELRRAPPTAVPEALRALVGSLERVGGDTAASDEMLRQAATQA